MTEKDDIIERYVTAFATLTTETMDDLLATVSPQVRFTDPFNDVTGHEAFRAIFTHMFETCEAPRFHVLDVAHGTQADSHRAYLRWRMSGRLRSWPHTSLDFEGMSEVHVGDDGLIAAHIDHWDSAGQLLARLPVIGTLLRPVLRMFQVRTGKS